MGRTQRDIIELKVLGRLRVMKVLRLRCCEQRRLVKLNIYIKMRRTERVRDPCLENICVTNA